MTRFSLLLIFFTALFISACNSTLETPQSPKLSQYTLIKENCTHVRLTPGIFIHDSVDEECRSFLLRLEKANDAEYKLHRFREKNPNSDLSRESTYIMLKKDANRQHRKTEVEYKKLSKELNDVSLDAIKHDELSDVDLTLTFVETHFTKAHYDYYSTQDSEYQEKSVYLIFEKKYTKKLINKGLVYLSKGDKRSALKTFKTAAKMRSSQAQYLVAIIYEAKNVDKAIAWHTKALKHGTKGSRINLARLHLRKHEPKISQKFYVEAAEEGDAYAQFLLYQQYHKTDNPKANAKALSWLKKSANNNFAPAANAYGMTLLKNAETEKALPWLIQASDHGLLTATEALGLLYYTQKEYDQALVCLQQVNTIKAKQTLAKMYEGSLGVNLDYYKAYMLYKDALKLGAKSSEKDVKRLARLTTSKEKAHYEAAKRKQRERTKKRRLEYGEKPILRNLRSAGTKIRLQGLVSLPLESSQGFIVTAADGKQFYVIDSAQAAHISQFQYVDISAKATANAISISSDNGLTIPIYQLHYLNKCH